MTNHTGCALDFPDDAPAYANYRGHRLVLADVRGDPTAENAGGDRGAAIRQWEIGLAKATGNLPAR